MYGSIEKVIFKQHRQKKCSSQNLIRFLQLKTQLRHGYHFVNEKYVQALTFAKKSLHWF